MTDPSPKTQKPSRRRGGKHTGYRRRMLAIVETQEAADSVVPLMKEWLELLGFSFSASTPTISHRALVAPLRVDLTPALIWPIFTWLDQDQEAYVQLATDAFKRRRVRASME